MNNTEVKFSLLTSTHRDIPATLMSAWLSFHMQEAPYLFIQIKAQRLQYGVYLFYLVN